MIYIWYAVHNNFLPITIHEVQQILYLVFIKCESAVYNDFGGVYHARSKHLRQCLTT